MNKIKLFNYLEKQHPKILLNVLHNVFDEMTVSQKHTVFYQIYNNISSSPVNEKKLINDINLFYKRSLKGYYYAPFDINSKNFMNVPEETEEWFEQLGDYLEESKLLSNEGNHKTAVDCFHLLNTLIGLLGNHEIVFADEYGTWMITVDEKTYIKAYIKSLSKISTSEEFARSVVPLLKRDSAESFSNKVFDLVFEIATHDQFSAVKTIINSQKICVEEKNLNSL